MILTRSGVRWLYLAGAGICAALIAYVLYTQIYEGLAPCPLCIFQRIGFILAGVCFLAGAAFMPRGRSRLVYPILITLSAAWGAMASIRQLWLQSLPADAVPSCGPGLGYMLDSFGFLRGLRMVFAGSGECAEVDWAFWGLSMAGWALIFFIIVVLLAWFGVFAATKRQCSKHVA